jgi:hypothetical protein
VVEQSREVSDCCQSEHALVPLLSLLQVPTVRICTISAGEQATCLRVAPLMSRASDGTMQFACIQTDGEAGCLAAIENKQADMRSFDGPDVYRGYVDHNLMVRLLVWVSDDRLSEPGLLFVRSVP